MRRFKTIFKSALSLCTQGSLLCTLSVLVGCNLPAPKDNTQEKGTNNQVATFTAHAVADDSRAVESPVQGEFSLPSSKTFNLKACVKDVAYDKPIPGHEFLIEETNKKVTADKSGCLNWAERIDFNYLADSQYIRIERHIIGQGLQKGAQTVFFAINPWSHGESLPAVLDPENNKIEKLIEDKQQGVMALKGLSADNTMTTRSLWVEDGRLFVTEQKLSADGIILHIDLKANVSIQMKRMNDEKFLRPLSTGSFKGRMKLIHIYQENNKEIRRLLSETDFIDRKMAGGILNLIADLTLPAIPTRGQVLLGLELQPVQGPPGLKNFEGVYFLGEYDQIKGSSFLKVNSSVIQGKEFKISDYVNSSVAELPRNLKNDTIEADNYQKPKIEVSPLEFKYLRTATREIFFNIKACVRHGVDQKSARSQTFKITKFRQSEKELEKTVSINSDNNSCLNWDESFAFNYLDCQHYVKGSVQIKNADLAMKEKLEILVNPWDRNGLDIRDMRYVDTIQNFPLSCQTENRPLTQLSLAGYSYNTLSYNYSIDSFLNLTVSKKVQLKMDPRLTTYSNLTGGWDGSQKLRDGVYLLRTAVVQNQDYDTNNTYVTSADRLVNVIDGVLSTELTFQTQDLKALGNRNNILVEIYPVDENKVIVSEGKIAPKNPNDSLESVINLNTGLRSPTFVGPITLNIDNSNQLLRIMDATEMSQFFLTGQSSTPDSEKFIIQKIVNQGLKNQAERIKKIQQRADNNQYAKENNLDLISLKGADETAPLAKTLGGSSRINEVNIISKAELHQFVSLGKLTPQTAHKLCAFWAVDYLSKIKPDKGGAIKEEKARDFARSCMSAVDKDPTKFFKVEKQLHIDEVGGSRYLKGYNEGFSVGKGFSVNNSHSETNSMSRGVVAKFVAAKELLKIFEIAGGGEISLSWSSSDSESSSNSVSVDKATVLTQQRNVFKIHVNKYEPCAVIRLNSKLFIKDTKWFGLLSHDYLNALNPRLTEKERENATNRGLMICSGELKNQPLDIIENYYLISQESSNSQMQDNGDARNRNFFIALRSKNDFNRFILATKASQNRAATSNKEDDTEEDLNNLLEHLFQMPGPTYPGMYLVQ